MRIACVAHAPLCFALADLTLHKSLSQLLIRKENVSADCARVCIFAQLLHTRIGQLSGDAA